MPLIKVMLQKPSCRGLESRFRNQVKHFLQKRLQLERPGIQIAQEVRGLAVPLDELVFEGHRSLLERIHLSPDHPVTSGKGSGTYVRQSDQRLAFAIHVD